MELSLAEENYLKSIYHLSENGDTEVSTNAIAEDLQTKPASVSDMMRKLSDKGVIEYQKYKGVHISDKGKKIALNVIRKHRLWEVFLLEKLGFRWDEVHDIAEQLEHIKSPLLIKKLDAFLGYPSVDPHGDPIPTENGEINIQPQKSLMELNEGELGQVINVPDSNPALLRHLDQIKMKLGSLVKVIEKVEFDGSVLISIDNQSPIYLSGAISENIMLKLK
ncbi:metal-dependent transcriptional regulator [Marinoscillum sp. MHG1-6]|uniref:metal-dependent transcriptional regulator n=1 Tax=Marinoscillum sp. MHG1-6 TaxID=2959627 RepID=UPI002157CE76|nr:metal-dependent transcriptional regulator [Marinoscillum sp. MHG1-6]